MGLNSDEAFTGLQAYEVLRGHLSLVPSGNGYGATTEAYLLAPLLATWTGVWPLRLLATLLSAVASVAIFRLAAPLLGRAPGLVVALVGWSMSGALVLLWSKSYMGYTTGLTAQVVTLTLAGRAMRTTDRLATTAAAAGTAAGLAMWSHPMFGVVSLLALVCPAVAHRMRLRRWWIPAIGGWLVGAAPWLVFIARNGIASPGSPRGTSFVARLTNFGTELLPRVFGLRSMTGEWVGPEPGTALGPTVLVLLTVTSLSGLVLLVRRRGRAALPLLVTGLLAYPVLALLPQLWFFADARYGLPFVPQLLMGLGAWMLLLPGRTQRSWWPVVLVPTVWLLTFCVPVVHHRIGFAAPVDPDADIKRAVAELEARDIRLVAGSYWSTYLADYVAGGRFDVSPDDTVRLVGSARVVQSADPADVALIYPAGSVPRLRLAAERYSLLRVGALTLYIPDRMTSRASA